MPPPFKKNPSDIDVGDRVRAGRSDITKSIVLRGATVRLDTEARRLCGL